MKEISATCSCGSTIRLKDERGTYINGGGRPDEKGRVFLIDAQFDHWQDMHKDHAVMFGDKVGKP